MGQSLSLLTAAMLVAQTPTVDGNGKNCACKNGQPQGRVVAQPEFSTETRASSWFGWRNGASTTTTVTEWRNSSSSGSFSSSSSSSDGSWINNRPVLSRIRNWIRGDDDSEMMRMEAPRTGEPVIIQQGPSANQYYRKLPTTHEPPLGATPAAFPPVKSSESGDLPKIITPTSQRPTLDEEQPLTIEVAPIEFRPAGQAKGASQAVRPALATATGPQEGTVQPALATVSNRPNPISSRFEGKVGQPGDYSWITGQLEIRNGKALIHYATPDTIDRHNGTLELSGGDLKNLRSGDLVSTHGNVVQQGGRAVYQLRSIDLIER